MIIYLEISADSLEQKRAVPSACALKIQMVFYARVLFQKTFSYKSYFGNSLLILETLDQNFGPLSYYFLINN